MTEYIRTYTGIEFPVKNQQVHHICSEDIVHALPKICRFNGHVKRFYSVAQHSILINSISSSSIDFDEDISDACLLHDFAETYICDLPSPFKSCLEEYVELEERLHDLVYERYNCPRMKDDVSFYDKVCLHIEKKDLTRLPEGYSSPYAFVLHRKPRFATRHVPQFYVRYKLRKLLKNLCKRRGVEY